MADLSKNFKFWLPLEQTIEKGSDGKPVMKLKGIASTGDEDTDGETLSPEGFDLSFFKKKGVINWHHLAKNNPATIIGEPTKAEIRKGELYVECKLYNTPLAAEVYNLAKTFQEESDSRRLGFSIEGKAILKDPLDDKKILKAKITGLAVTHMPKNSATFAEIMKGEVDSANDFEYEEEDEAEAEELIKSTANGGTITIIGNNGRVSISEEGNVVVEINKSLDSTTGAALMPESLDGVTKRNKDDDNDEDDEDDEEDKDLTKAQIYNKIFIDYPDIDIEKSQKLYNFIIKINDMSKLKNPNELINDEKIEKAYELLGLNKADDIDLEKAKASNNVDNDEDEDDDEDEEEDGVAKVEKSEVDDLNKDNEAFEKAIDTRVTKIKEDLLEESREKFKGVGTILKGMVEDIKAMREDYNAKIEELSSQPAAGRKSFPTAVAIEKAFGGGDIAKAANTRQLSKSANKKEILDVLETCTFEKGVVDNDFATAMTTFESSNVLLPTIVARLELEKKITIVQ